MLTKTSFTIRLHPNDDVVIARTQLVSGTTLLDENVKISGLVPPGHKVATRAIAPGEASRAGRWWWETNAPKECGIHCAVESGGLEHELHALLGEGSHA